MKALLRFIILSLGVGVLANTSGSLTITSDYTDRGLTQTFNLEGKNLPAVQGALQYDANNFSVGTGASSVNIVEQYSIDGVYVDGIPESNAYLELEFFAEFKHTLFGWTMGSTLSWIGYEGGEQGNQMEWTSLIDFERLTMGMTYGFDDPIDDRKMTLEETQFSADADGDFVDIEVTSDQNEGAEYGYVFAEFDHTVNERIQVVLRLGYFLDDEKIPMDQSVVENNYIDFDLTINYNIHDALVATLSLVAIESDYDYGKENDARAILALTHTF